jgi:hypothetical protein
LLKAVSTVYINWNMAVQRLFINPDSDLKSTVIKQGSYTTASCITAQDYSATQEIDQIPKV